MKILAGEPNGAAAKIAKSLNVGCMITTCTKKNQAGPRHKDFLFTAIDNGAFGCWKSGREFNGELFLDNVTRSNKLELNPLFVVCPDIVAGGLESLKFSLSWIDKIEYNKKALVVQDGMRHSDLIPAIDQFQYLFVGGSVSWKWATAENWILFAHNRGLKCHIGQCGQLWMLEAAKRFGADSVDSTSWVVNNSWHIIKEYQNPQQLELF